MKVVCTRVRDNKTSEWVKQNFALTVGKEYVVLQIEFALSQKNKNYYRMICDDDERTKSPALFCSDQFLVVDGTIPKSWVVCQSQMSEELGPYMDIGPASWHAPGFWDNFYDGDPNAEEIYRREAMLIYEEAGYEV
jgi:hypothetical protein